MKVHIANTALHYGQSVFEGLKAFHGKDGRCVRALRCCLLLVLSCCCGLRFCVVDFSHYWLVATIYCSLFVGSQTRRKRVRRKKVK